MTREDAIAIFRDRLRKSAQAKAALDWAATNPAPDLIPFLLMLHSDAWAGRQGQAMFESVQEAILLCAKIDSDPLWTTLEGDWDYSRLSYAGQMLAQLEDWRRERMRVLLTKPVPSEVWGFARYNAAAFEIPDSIYHQQEAWLQESVPNLDSAFWQAKRHRRATWPSAFDLAPLPPREYRHTVDESYGAKGGAVTRAWESLCHVDPSLAGFLRPGLSRDEVLSHMRFLARPFPGEVIELYQCADGGVELIPSYRFMPLKEAIEYHREAVHGGFMKTSDFPLMEWNGDMWMAALLAKNPSAESKIVSVALEDASRIVVASSLAVFLTKVAACFQRQRFRRRAGGEAEEDCDPAAKEWHRLKIADRP